MRPFTPTGLDNPGDILEQIHDSVAEGAEIMSGSTIVFSAIGFVFLWKGDPSAFAGCLMFIFLVPFTLAGALIYGITVYGFSHRRIWAYKPARYLMGWYGRYHVSALQQAMDKPEVRVAYGLQV